MIPREKIAGIDSLTEFYIYHRKYEKLRVPLPSMACSRFQNFALLGGICAHSLGILLIMTLVN